MRITMSKAQQKSSSARAAEKVADLPRKHVARIIHVWRTKGKMTREMLAATIGVSVSTIVRWERPTSNPRLCEIVAMEQACPGLLAALFGSGLPVMDKSTRLDVRGDFVKGKLRAVPSPEAQTEEVLKDGEGAPEAESSNKNVVEELPDDAA